MTKARTLKTAVALGSLTAAVALLSGMPSASAQQAPGSGSFPNSFLIPGTNTSIRVGGYVKLDVTEDFQGFQNLNGGASWGGYTANINSAEGSFTSGGQGFGPGNAPYRMHNANQFTASESRFNIETRTPTSYGEIKTFIEGDFTNPSGLTNGSSLELNSNSYGFRLRRAYATIGPWLFGQTDSTFKDGDAEAETLDFGGQAGLSGPNRQPQIRYTYVAGNGISVFGAAEQPATSAETGASSSGCTTKSTGGLTIGSPQSCTVSTSQATSFGQGGIQHIPDFIAGARYDAAWGHVSLRGVIRELTIGDNGALLARSQVGGGGGLGAQVNTWGKDNFQFDGVVGSGIGRYILDDNPWDTAYNTSTGAIENLVAWSASVAYQHWWLDNLRSTVAFGYVHEESPGSNFFAPVKVATGGAGFGFVNASNFEVQQFLSVHANLIWSPVPQMDVGAEFMYGYRQVWGGADANFERIQFSTKFKF